ncbi:MAG: IS3 family transposase [Candidatus Eisenbacteria bacterium]
MRKSRFSDEQIVAIVRESEREGVTVAHVAKKHGITETTLFRWRKRFGGLDANQAAELRRLQHENARLKKLVADLTVDIDILREVNAKKLVSAPARRAQVDYVVARGRSVRRACALMNVSRSALRYVSTMPARDAELASELTQIAARKSAYGYRFAWALLGRRGWRVNKKRVRRVWRLLRLHHRRRKYRKIRTGTARAFAPTGPNQVWAYDFTFDRCANGQTLKSQSIVDEWTRECLAIEVATSLTAARVIAVLERLFEQYGAPQVLRSDNGPEFIARALRIWVLFNHSYTATIDPGKPWQNGSVESFQATFRRECLDAEEFAHLREAKILIEQWRWEYNTQRPHSSLGYKTPAEFGNVLRAAMKSEVHPIMPEPLS